MLVDSELIEKKKDGERRSIKGGRGGRFCRRRCGDR